MDGLTRNMMAALTRETDISSESRDRENGIFYVQLTTIRIDIRTGLSAESDDHKHANVYL